MPRMLGLSAIANRFRQKNVRFLLKTLAVVTFFAVVFVVSVIHHQHQQIQYDGSAASRSHLYTPGEVSSVNFQDVAGRIKFPASPNHHKSSSNQRQSLADTYKYNLLDRTTNWQLKMAADHTECTLEYMNTNKLAQDHPCVIDMIRRHYLEEPSPPDVPYNLTDATAADSDHSQAGQVSTVLGYLKNKKKGFFIECGANDGEFVSNTLYMEHKLHWSGLLIEADAKAYEKLLTRNRKSWKSPACLSTEPYPTQISFQPTTGEISFLSLADKEWATSKQEWWEKPQGKNVTVQCFPLYSLLLAVNQTRVDFFSLDIDGHELKVLRTIPWHLVDIRTLTVEVSLMTKLNELDDFIRYMETTAGYLKATEAYIGKVHDTTLIPLDVIFIKDTLNNPPSPDEWQK